MPEILLQGVRVVKAGIPGGAVAQGQAAVVVAAKIDFDAADESRTDDRDGAQRFSKRL